MAGRTSKRGIHRPEEGRRVDKVKALKEEKSKLLTEANKLLDSVFKIKQRVEEINLELDKEPDTICVSDHAIVRFKQRIQNVPNNIAKKILSDRKLLEKYKKYGEGAYRVSTHPHILAVVSNYVVVTCYSRFDYKVRLRELEKYMEFYIRELVHQKRNDFSYKIDSFSKFRKSLYK